MLDQFLEHNKKALAQLEKCYTTTTEAAALIKNNIDNFTTSEERIKASQMVEDLGRIAKRTWNHMEHCRKGMEVWILDKMDKNSPRN